MALKWVCVTVQESAEPFLGAAPLCVPLLLHRRPFPLCHRQYLVCPDFLTVAILGGVFLCNFDLHFPDVC